MHQPFANTFGPVKVEVDRWNDLTFNHVQVLVGYTGEELQIQPDRYLCLHLYLCVWWADM